MISKALHRRDFLKTAAAGANAGALPAAPNQAPNIVFILADDLGYGDLGCYGSRLSTPNIDQMANDGMLFQQFYSANPVCSPARAALLTGRYPTRCGVQRVLYPTDTIGLSGSETTMAQMLKSQGYKTMCIGKWHLGSTAQYMPTNRGFDEFYGLPYSVDMYPLPLMHNLDVIEPQATLQTLTSRYTDQAVKFINNSGNSPFFLYMAHSFPHIPIAASPSFRGTSGLGLYGDAVAEIDWSVGQVLQALQANGLDQNTLVMFSSDHGPWYQGSAGKLRGRKGETYEGGVRTPFIARLPGQIPAGTTCNGIASAMDILPTVARLSNAALPPKPLDGIDIWPLLNQQIDSLDREALLYFDDWQLQCARLGPWKLHVARYNSVVWAPQPPGGRINLPLRNPELYNIQNDPEESYDLAPDYPDVVAQIQARILNLLPTFPDPVNSYWRDTRSLAVQSTPADALPALNP